MTIDMTILRKITTTILIYVATTTTVMAQAVIFPQEKQPGQATCVNTVISGDDCEYVLSNDLFKAVYKKQDGKLTFLGCNEMGLKGEEKLFILRTQSGKEVSSADMTLSEVRVVRLQGDASAVKGSARFNGYVLEAEYTNNMFNATWRAVLRDGSHYLRTELELSPKYSINMSAVIPMIYTVDNTVGGQPPVVVGNTRGAVVASDRLFAGLETPMGINTAGESMPTEPFAYNSWNSSSFTWTPDSETPQGVINLGFTPNHISGTKGYMAIKESGMHTVKFQYTSGSHRLDIAGIDVLDAFTGEVVASDYHKGTTGGSSSNNTYSVNIPQAGFYLVRYFRDVTEEVTGAITGAFNSNGTITWSGNVSAPQLTYDGQTALNDIDSNTLHLNGPIETPIRGEWSRKTILKKNDTWKVSTVVGLIAKGQARRSFLAYSERERAVPWRPFTLYNSWFELNINRNNDRNYTNNYNEAQCLDVLSQWKTNLFDKHGLSIESFAWDDGWDEYGTWTFNPNFPNGFQKMSDAAAEMNSHIGAWLGPVGGYGESGNYRREYWNGKGGMQLSNSAYYDVFLNACTNMVNNYDFNFFKFDGISAQFSSVGPDKDATGEENAEAIIDIERRLRDIKPDLFFNTTVGTWASPFWFNVSDAVWRQENDYGTAGTQGTDRERWINYRDRLVYQNFVKNSPLCPINTLMTHGFILSKYGNVATNMTYSGVLRELRCAFACGSGLVELYADYALLNSINNGKLWDDIAECIKWQRDNSDVLPDIHWVGGNPWDGNKANIYGWASWNGKKATFALRNPSASRQSVKITLREALEIPEYISTTVTLVNAFNQSTINGLPVGSPIDIDTELTLSLPGSSVFVFNGTDNASTNAIVETSCNADKKNPSDQIFDMQGRQIGKLSTISGQLPRGIYIIGGKKTVITR